MRIRVIYRFRGATVRNMLEFTTRGPGCAVGQAHRNYRSHRRIVAAYDRWIASADWSNPRGLLFAMTRRYSRPQGRVPRLPGGLLDLG